jgi:hypothetical protein
LALDVLGLVLEVTMSLRIMVLVCALAASFLACAAENVDTRASLPVSELDTPEGLAADSLEVVSGADSLELAPDAKRVGRAAAECRSEDTCARHGGGTDCVWIGDTDCGETFCRVPSEQCGGHPATFQRVEHLYVCARPSGGECYQSHIGRYLVACGC